MDQFNQKLKKIRLFATDFDGVHTDGMVYVDGVGKETVRCSRKDGLGYEMLANAGITACVISKEANPVVLERCKKLKITCYQNVADGQGKLEILKNISAKFGFAADEILYMGDDINDREALEFAGVAVAVKDCHTSLLGIVDYVTTVNGGEHAIREVCELIISAKNLPIDV